MNSVPPPAPLASYPTVAQAYQLLQSGRVDEADRASQAILRHEPSQPDALLIHGIALVRRGANGEGRDALERALAARPEFPFALFVRADLLRAAGSTREALDDLATGLASEWAPGAGREPLKVFEALLSVLATQPPAKWWPRMPQFQAFGALLAAHVPVEEATRIFDAAGRDERALREPAVYMARFLGLVGVSGFEKSAPAAWNHEFFERAALPWLLRALEANLVDAALAMEGVIYQEYVKQTETETHFEASMRRWKDAMRSAGTRFAASLPPVARAPSGDVPSVAFFVHNVSELAHVQMVLGLLEGNASLSPPRFKATVFCYFGKPAMLERFRRTGAHVEALTNPGTQADHRQVFALLRRRIAELGIDMVVWVSLVLAMPFAFAMRIAPAQVWWALKYHRFESPEIDAYLTGGGIEGGFKTIDGRQWRGGSVPGTDWTRPEAAAEAARVRAALGNYRIVYGTFGREEKLDSPEFIATVARILKAVPDAGFLWTGRVRLPRIQAQLEAEGVADRCHFIGWVDTKLYAQVIDVFLDSFPFPCGFTVYESMAAGKPSVFYLSAESVHTGANALIAPLLETGDPDREGARLARSIFRPDGEDYYLHATTPDEYVAFATRLASDAGFRERTGAACRGFVDHFMADRARAARIYADHFDAVLAETRARNQG